MSETVIALLFAAGAATWIYSKIYQRTGGNTKSSLLSAAACGVGIFILVWILFSLLLPE